MVSGLLFYNSIKWLHKCYWMWKDLMEALCWLQPEFIHLLVKSPSMYLNDVSDNFYCLKKQLVVSRPLTSEEMFEKQTLSQRGDSDISELIFILYWNKDNNKNVWGNKTLK